MAAKNVKTSKPADPAAGQYAADRTGKLAELQAAFSGWPVKEVPLAELAEKDTNSRHESPARQAELKKMAESIRTLGQLQDACGYMGVDGRVHLVWGFSRAAACRIAGKATLRARVSPMALRVDEVELLRGTENIFRIALNGAELALQVTAAVNATALHHPKGLKGAIAQVAEDFAIKPEQAQDCLHVVERLMPATRSLLAAGRLTLAQARELATIGGGDQEGIAEDVALEAEPRRGARIITVEEIRGRIANRQHSLKIVPWKLEALMKLPESMASLGAGRTLGGDLSGCLACRHNTASSAGLFDQGKAEAATDGGAGFCRLPACFEWKQREAANGQEKAVEKLRGKVKAKQLGKEEAGGAAAVRDVTPEFLKEAGVQRLARKEFGEAKTQAGGGEVKKEKTEKERRQESLAKWIEAYRKWAQGLEKKFEAAIAGDRHRKTAAVLLLACEPVMPSFLLPSRWELEQVGSSLVAPPREKAITPTTARLLTLAASVARHDVKTEEMDELLDALNYPSSGDRKMELAYLGPESVLALCGTFGVGFEPEPPAFEDFLPKDLQAENPRAADKPKTIALEQLAEKPAAKRAKKAEGVKGKAMFDPGQLVYHKSVKLVGEVVELASNLAARVRLPSGHISEWRCTDCRTPKEAEALAYNDLLPDGAKKPLIDLLEEDGE